MPLHAVEAIWHIVGVIAETFGFVKALFSAKERDRLRQLGTGQLPAALLLGAAAFIVIAVAVGMIFIAVLPSG
jgi:hypothetical protein